MQGPQVPASHAVGPGVLGGFLIHPALVRTGFPAGSDVQAAELLGLGRRETEERGPVEGNGIVVDSDHDPAAVDVLDGADLADVGVGGHWLAFLASANVRNTPSCLVLL